MKYGRTVAFSVLLAALLGCEQVEPEGPPSQGVHLRVQNLHFSFKSVDQYIGSKTLSRMASISRLATYLGFQDLAMRVEETDDVDPSQYMRKCLFYDFDSLTLSIPRFEKMLRFSEIETMNCGRCRDNENCQTALITEASTFLLVGRYLQKNPHLPGRYKHNPLAAVYGRDLILIKNFFHYWPALAGRIQSDQATLTLAKQGGLHSIADCGLNNWNGVLCTAIMAKKQSESPGFVRDFLNAAAQKPQLRLHTFIGESYGVTANDLMNRAWHADYMVSAEEAGPEITP